MRAIQFGILLMAASVILCGCSNGMSKNTSKGAGQVTDKQEEPTDTYLAVPEEAEEMIQEEGTATQEVEANKVQRGIMEQITSDSKLRYYGMTDQEFQYYSEIILAKLQNGVEPETVKKEVCSLMEKRYVLERFTMMETLYYELLRYNHIIVNPSTLRMTRNTSTRFISQPNFQEFYQQLFVELHNSILYGDLSEFGDNLLVSSIAQSYNLSYDDTYEFISEIVNYGRIQEIQLAESIRSAFTTLPDNMNPSENWVSAQDNLPPTSNYSVQNPITQQQEEAPRDTNTIQESTVPLSKQDILDILDEAQQAQYTAYMTWDEHVTNGPSYAKLAPAFSTMEKVKAYLEKYWSEEDIDRIIQPITIIEGECYVPYGDPSSPHPYATKGQIIEQRPFGTDGTGTTVTVQIELFGEQKTY